MKKILLITIALCFLNSCTNVDKKSSLLKEKIKSGMEKTKITKIKESLITKVGKIKKSINNPLKKTK